MGVLIGGLIGKLQKLELADINLVVNSIILIYETMNNMNNAAPTSNIGC